MNHPKIQTTHLDRKAYVYIRQSTKHQVDHHIESQQRQYELTRRAGELGWEMKSVLVIDDDLGISASGRSARAGFERLVSDVALGQAGIVLGLEVSRLARNNHAWYGLLDLCALKQTLIGDADGVYDPCAYNDRLLLGLKGTMSEAELHLIKSRMLAGLRHKAAKGELRFPLPAGYEFDDANSIVKTNDEEVAHFVELVFSRMLELQSVSGVCKALLHEGLRFPRRDISDRSIRWERPYYRAVYMMLTNPIYAGTYAWGRSKVVTEVEPDGTRRTRQRSKPRDEWDVVLDDHHPAYVSRQNFNRIQQMIDRNRPTVRHEAALTLREGSALLQGIVRCGRCGRSMMVRYAKTSGQRTMPTYACSAARVQNRAKHCQSVGGRRLEMAVSRLFLDAMAEGQLEIHLAALRALSERDDATVTQLELQLERARYEAARVERQYNVVEPENRVVARTLESRWNESLAAVAELEERIALRKRQIDRRVTRNEEAQLRKLSKNLPALWEHKAITDKDRKALLRAVIDEVQLDKQDRTIAVKIIWKGGLASMTTVSRARQPPPAPTPPDVVELVRELATRHTDAQIARTLARRGIRTPRTNTPYNAHSVTDFRRRYEIPRCPEPTTESPATTYTVQQTAKLFKVSTPTIYSWLKLGILEGEQLAPGAPWSITITETDRRRLAVDAPSGWLPIDDAASELGVSKQTVLNWVKARKVPYAYANRGRRRGIRIDVNSAPRREQKRLLD
jgi:DNA invertase Pin-like site-specific DNA recombinase/transposase/uncharacterized small protein (DUF1192 family)